MKFLWCFVIIFYATEGTPIIFGEIQTCDFHLKIGKKTKTFTVPLYEEVHNRELTMLISMCGTIPTVFPNDGTCTGVCIYNKFQRKLEKTVKTKRNSTWPFKLVDPVNLSFEFLDDILCNGDQRYNIIIKFSESKDWKKPRLYMEDDCTIEVELLRPDFEPQCTEIHNKNLIDLRSFKQKDIAFPFEGKQFHLSLCGSNPRCEFAAGCFIEPGGKMTQLGEANQRVYYDNLRRQLRVNTQKSKKANNIEVLIKCNWNVAYFDKPKYKKPQEQGRTYRFEIESSFGCIKPVTTCLLTDDEFATYNLRGLTKKDGYKLQSGNKTFFINICGDLSFNDVTKNNSCLLGHSQVCQVDSNNIYTNLGSIPFLQPTRDKTIEAIFESGESCGDGASYTTKIDLVCSNTDTGPKLISQVNCSTIFRWETPKACPKFLKETNACVSQSYIGHLNLTSLATMDERKNRFSPQETFSYNLCGTLNSPCDSEPNVTACYTKGVKQRIIGLNAPQLSIDNWNVQLKYVGTDCGKKKSSFTVDLFCSFAKNPKPLTVNKKDECTFVGKLYSPLACLSQKSVGCQVRDRGKLYDLSPLMREDDNYVIRHPTDKNIRYLLNVCRPVINSPGLLLLTSESMVYMQNLSEPNIWNRFVAMGKTASPHIRNGKLLVHASLGNWCHLGTEYNSEIEFECSRSEEQPILLNIVNCSAKFLWRSKYACPIQLAPSSSCSIKHSNIDFIFPSDEIKIGTSHGEEVTFSFCSDEYKTCRNGLCRKGALQESRWSEGGNLHFSLNLSNEGPCTNGAPLKKINITLECDKTDAKFTAIRALTEENCQLKVSMKTGAVCRNDDHAVKPIHHYLVGIPIENRDRSKELTDQQPTLQSNENMKTSVVTSEQHKTTVPRNVVHEIQPLHDVNTAENKPSVELDQNKNNSDEIVYDIDTNDKLITSCPFGNNYTLEDIKSSVVQAKTESFSINFDGSLTDCAALICKNNLELLHFRDECPTVTHLDKSIQLEYTLHEKCRSEDSSSDANVRLKIQLTCNRTSHYTSLLNNSNCNLHFGYSSSTFCEPINESTSSGILLTLGVLIVLGALCLIAFRLYQKNCLKKCEYHNVSDAVMNHFKDL